MSAAPVRASANRLEQRLAELRRRGGKGLAPYVTAGDGGLETTLAVLRALDDAGAACVELGVPFSDPIADGPLLQQAADRALADGTTLAGILSTVREFRSGSRGRPGSELPVALMSYSNPLLRRGWSALCRDAAKAGVDALIVPDLPPEEAGEMREAALSSGICPIFFVAPTTTEPRVRMAAEASRGFLYVVGRTGVTGAATDIDAATVSFLQRVRAAAALPLAVGFGLATPGQVAAALAHADLAIVGSALVRHIHESARSAPDFVAAAARAAAGFLTELRRGLP